MPDTSQDPTRDLEKGVPNGHTGRDYGDEQSTLAPATQRRSPASLKDSQENESNVSAPPPEASGKQAERQEPASDDKDALANRQKKDSSDAPIKYSVFHGPPVDDPNPAADRLDDDETPLSDDDFYHLIGMRKPTTAHEQRQEEDYTFKLATKHGLYRTICEELRFIQYKYRIFDVMAYLLLAAQLAISAVFIVLGATGRSGIVIAVLGAISTVIGGVQSLMKGQGLPNRLRQARNQMRNVVFEANELFWDFRSGRDILYSDVKKIREDYLRVLEEMRKHHPDTWTNEASQVAKRSRRRNIRR